MAFQKALRVLRTVKHLKAEQLAFQLYYRVRKANAKSVSNIPLRDNLGEIRFPAFRHISTQDGRSFDFLGEKGTLEDAASWNDPNKSKLWLYNLHYLDDLASLEAPHETKLLSSLLENWIQNNPVGKGNGWEPYPLSLRIVNIIKWLYHTGHRDQAILDSLATQVEALSDRIERHLLGNHIFANGKALVFAGAFFSSPQGNRWLQKGLKILEREVPKQFLADGGHVERSPMYHATLLWDMCDLLSLTNATPELAGQRSCWKSVIEKGLHWLQAMVHPDGEIAFFNDSAFGIAPTLDQIKRYAATLKIQFSDTEPSKLLGASGFLSSTLPGEHKLLANVGNIAPAYQPGHAHAESLSFELSLFGQRLFVNSGTSEYGTGPVRNQQRRTRSHNTVEIDGHDSSEVWSGFRVGRRAEILSRSFSHTPKQTTLTASHNGYRFLRGGPIHTRSFNLESDALHIEDRIQGNFSTAIARFHLHPDIELQSAANDSPLSARFPSGETIRIEFSDAATIEIESSTWHPRFGHSTPNQRIVVTFAESLLKTNISWEQT